MFIPVLIIYALVSISNPIPKAGGFSVAETVSLHANKNSTVTLASKSFSLNQRYGNEFVNGIFRDNILLTLNYLEGRVNNKSEINWSDVTKPGQYKFTLKPGESFAFHDQILPAYKKVVKTTNAHFNFQDGFKSSGSLFGDGVCHLASLLYWASKDAGLETHSPINHNFAKINEVPKEYGVSIYYMPKGFEKSSRENLYITNNLEREVSFVFNYDGNHLSVDIKKSNS